MVSKTLFDITFGLLLMLTIKHYFNACFRASFKLNSSFCYQYKEERLFNEFLMCVTNLQTYGIDRV